MEKKQQVIEAIEKKDKTGLKPPSYLLNYLTPRKHVSQPLTRRPSHQTERVQMCL